jgi:hypothetical protein
MRPSSRRADHARPRAGVIEQGDGTFEVVSCVSPAVASTLDGPEGQQGPVQRHRPAIGGALGDCVLQRTLRGCEIALGGHLPSAARTSTLSRTWTTGRSGGNSPVAARKGGDVEETTKQMT